MALIPRISAQELAAMYASQPLIIDVRKKSEFDSEHIINAKNIPLASLNENLDRIPKDSPFILYCGGGYRSMIAASILKQCGWNDFKDVQGGFAAIAKTTIPKSDYVCPTTFL